MSRVDFPTPVLPVKAVIFPFSNSRMGWAVSGRSSRTAKVGKPAFWYTEKIDWASAKSALVNTTTGAMDWCSATAMSWSSTRRLGAGSARLVTSTSWSRLARGGRTSWFFRGRMALTMLNPWSFCSTLTKSPTRGFC